MFHGGRLEDARRQFPDAPGPPLDLSTGINPIPYPVPALSPESFTRLPEPGALAALSQAAAAAYGARDAACVVPAPGAQSLISLLPYVVRARTVAVLGPTYAEYAAAWSTAGAAVTEVTTFEELGHADIAVLCNPNNPDGRTISPARIAGLASRVSGRGGLVVVDEAFADLESGGLSLVPTLPDRGAIVLRSFGKAFGLGGVRLGFAVAARDVASALRAALGPWPVSGAAIAIGTAALGDTRWRQAAAARLADDGTRLDSLLTQAGLSILGGTRLFRLCGAADAAATHDRLGRAGIVVRRFPARPAWLRFGLPGLASDWDRLASAVLRDKAR